MAVVQRTKGNIAFRNPGKLIPMAREMLDKAAAFGAESVAANLELKIITAGQIADLCHIQHGTKYVGSNVAYEPLL